jgi:LAO/AO transport system kinase
VKTVATTGVGVVELVEAINKFRSHSTSAGAKRRRDRSQSRLRELVSQRVMSRLEQSTWGKGELESMVERVAAREIDPYTAADQLVEKAFA